MKKNIWTSSSFWIAVTLLLLSVYGYLQFGLSALVLGLLTLTFALIALAYKNPLVADLSNVGFALFFVMQSIINNNSFLVNNEASCLDICIGYNLPLLFIRGFSVVVFVLALSVLTRRLVEKK